MPSRPCPGLLGVLLPRPPAGPGPPVPRPLSWEAPAPSLLLEPSSHIVNLIILLLLKASHWFPELPDQTTIPQIRTRTYYVPAAVLGYVGEQELLLVPRWELPPSLCIISLPLGTSAHQPVSLYTPTKTFC